MFKKFLENNKNIIRGMASVYRVFSDRNQILQNRALREKELENFLLSELYINARIKKYWQNVGNHICKAIEQQSEKNYSDLIENYFTADDTKLTTSNLSAFKHGITNPCQIKK